MKNKGFSMIQMVVTVIIIIVVAAFAIFYSGDTTKEAKLAKVFNEITEIKNAISQVKVLNEIDPVTYSYSNLFGESIADMTTYYSKIGIDPETQSGTEYYFLINRNDKKALEMERVEYEYIFEMNSGKIYLIDGVARNGEIIYEYDDIFRQYNDVFNWF